MKLIQPVLITNANLTSTNVPEDDYTEWSAATYYTINDLVIVLATNRVYKSQINSNIGKYPPDSLDDGDPAADPAVPDSWMEVSVTNKWKMFDSKARSATIQADSIAVEIIPGELYNSLALLNIEADSVSVEVDDPTDGIVYTHDVEMIDLTGIDDYYEWFFFPIAKRDNIVLLDLPAYANATLTVIATDSSEDVEIGELVIGSLKKIGKTLYGTSVGLIDYSRKEIDEYGNATIEERTYSKRNNFAVSVATRRIYDIQKTLAKYRATPLVYIGVESKEETVMYGFYRDFSIVLGGPVRSGCNLQVEELS